MFSVFRFVSFVLFALSLFQLIDAYALKRAPAGSNGQRLAKRIPLPRPKRLYDPHRPRTDPSATPTTAASETSTTSSPSSSPSSTPPSTPTSTSLAPAATRTGYISLSQIDAVAPVKKRDTLLGYVGEVGMVTALPDATELGTSAWEFSYVVPDPADNVVQLHVATPGVASYADYNLGAMSVYNSFACPSLGAGSVNYLLLGSYSGSTPAGSETCAFMVSVLENQGYTKTTIFSIDPDTDEITVQWVNPDGTTPTTYVVEFTNVEWSYGIFITGDLSTLATNLDTTVESLNQVKLYFNEVAAN